MVVHTLASSLPAQERWGPAHAHGADWLEWLAHVAPWILLALLVVAVVRAIALRGRYRAVSALGEADQERVHAAIRDAERRTVGEVLPVVVERSDSHASAEWLSALTLLVIGSPLLAGVLPWDLPALVLTAQLGLGAVGFGLARALPDYKQLFISRRRKEHVANEQALQEFYTQGLHKTVASTGVLVFVSLLEQRVVVLADEGIAAKVDGELWQEVDAAILEGIVSKSLADGLVRGIERAGGVLAEHFPWTDGDRNEVPDRLILRRE